jgi:hypothetical protein
MLRYECDNCHRLKQPDETWILGFAAENIGVTAARREITIAARWDAAGAVDYLAVHFCSDECRRKYTALLFGEAPPTGEIVEQVRVVPRKRVVKTAPSAQVKRRAAGRARSSKRKTA